MSVVAPPEPPRQEEPEALIPEARARQRRRVLLIAAGVVAAVGIGLAVWASLRGGGSLAAGQSGHRAGTVDHSRAALRGRRGLGEVGSGGGMTWAISGRGFWLTANGGLTWHPALLPRSSGGVTGSRADPIANIRDVQFVDRLHGWVSTVAGPGIYVTADGGRTWAVSTPPGCRSTCVGGALDFLDARNGFALFYGRSGSDRLYRTGDAGRTWQLVSQPPV